MQARGRGDAPALSGGLHPLGDASAPLSPMAVCIGNICRLEGAAVLSIELRRRSRT